ncbi:MAG: HEAT repeat domain-containing protein [Verrucomicrobia bacterium]|nr:HEAT repeat domain-containing protein [Verrucomicrobiota bacterium]
MQLIGGPEAVSTLGKLLTDESLCTDAARTLLAVGNGAVEQLRAALPRVSGKCRLVLMQSLAACGDAASGDAMRAALADPDRDMRLAAVWGLARIGDEGAADLLLKAASVAPSFERTKATQACLLLAENLVAAGKKKVAVGIYTRLRDSRTEAKEHYIRDLAAKALRALGEV